jgi:hypothetical protein
VKPVLRRFLVTAATVAALGVLAVGWIASAFLFSPCEYALMRARVSPSERYVAEIYGASCGISGSRSVVMLRDRSALGLARVDETPPGTVIANDFNPAGDDLFWEGEATLVLQYAGAEAPKLVSGEWGGVRIEARQVVRAE